MTPTAPTPTLALGQVFKHQIVFGRTLFHQSLSLLKPGIRFLDLPIRLLNLEISFFHLPICFFHSAVSFLKHTPDIFKGGGRFGVANSHSVPTAENISNPIEVQLSLGKFWGLRSRVLNFGIGTRILMSWWMRFAYLLRLVPVYQQTTSARKASATDLLARAIHAVRMGLPAPALPPIPTQLLGRHGALVGM